MLLQERITAVFQQIGADIKTLLSRSRCVLMAQLSAATGAIANTETRVVSLTVPANTFAVGDTVRIVAMGLHTNATQASTSVYRVRIGPTTLTGVIPASHSFVNGTTARTNVVTKIEVLILVTAIGASAAALGQCHVDKGYASATTPAGVTAGVTFNSTVQNFVELTFISGHAQTTNNIHAATIEVLR